METRRSEDSDLIQPIKKREQEVKKRKGEKGHK